MDNVIVGIVLALIGLAVQPPVNGIAFSGGPHFSNYGEERTLGMTATVAATTSWGLELGGRLRAKGLRRHELRAGDEDFPARVRHGHGYRGGPALLRRCPALPQAGRLHRREALWRHEFLAGDRVTPNLLFRRACWIREQLPQRAPRLPSGRRLPHGR